MKRIIDRLFSIRRTKEELLDILREAHSQKVISSFLYAINEQIFRVADKPVEEVMVHRVDMITVRENMTLREVIEQYKKWGFTKMPVVKENIDDVVGVLYIKELIKHIDEIDRVKAKELAIDPYYIPDSKKVLDALRELQRRRMSIAIVVDEFGNVVGLVTLEDLLEEIVGEIWEEFDREEILSKKLDDGSFVFNTKIELEEVSKILGRNLEAEGVHTLSGFIFSRLERVPQAGEHFEIDGLEIDVIEATQQRLKKVKIELREKPEPKEETTEADKH